LVQIWAWRTVEASAAQAQVQAIRSGERKVEEGGRKELTRRA
jgi:hypothetical protein